MDMPRITLGTAFDDAERDVANAKPYEFLGEVVKDEIGPGYEGKGYQWVIAVKPLAGNIGGKTGAWHEFVPGKEKPNTKFAFHLERWGEVFGSDTSIGEGKLIGRVAWFVRKDRHVYGTDKKGTEYAGSVLYPTKLATDEDLEPFGRLSNTTKDAFSWTSDNIELALTILDGVEKKRFAAATFKAKLDDKALVEQLVSGQAAAYLVDKGLAEMDGSKLVRVS